MKNYVALVFVTISLSFGWSQSQGLNHHLTAMVFDGENMPIEIGNVYCLDVEDSSLIAGDVFYDGSIEMHAPQQDGFIVMISALGFKPYVHRVMDVHGGLSLGNVHLETMSLASVEVIASRELFRRTDQGAVVQVAGTPMSNAGSVLDALRNTPLVFVNSSNQVSVIGKGAALIYVDGQLLSGSQVLDGLSSDEIQEIEILQNPPAKYDAGGNAIINIKTKQKYLEGHRVGLVQELGKGRFWRGYAKANGYIKAGNFLLQGSYGIRPWAFTARNDYGRTYERSLQTINIENSYRYKTDIWAGDYVAKATWLPNADSRLGLHINGTHSQSDRSAFNSNYFFQDKAPVFSIATELGGPLNQHSTNYNLFYDSKLDSLGSSIFISGQFSDYELSRREDIEQAVVRGERAFVTNRRSINTNDIRVLAAQADLQKFLSSKTTIGGGLKFSQIDNLSGLDFSGRDAAGVYFTIPELSTHYDYQESILASYLDVSWKMGGIDASVGLRGEKTNTRGVSGDPNEDVQLFDRDYWDLFPSFSLARDFDQGLRVSAGYNYRIIRPSFQELNPFTLYVDSLVSFVGNPLLRPEYSHSSNVTLSKNGVSVTLDHVYTKDKINTIIEIADPNHPALFQFVRDNIISTNMVSATLSFSVNKGRYSSFYTIVGRLEDHRYRDGVEIASNSQPGYYFYTNQGIRLPWDIQAALTLQYTSKRVDGLYLDDPISALGFSFSKRFLDDRLTMRIIGNDVIDDFKFIGTAEIYDNDWTYLSRGDWQYLKLALNWNFGKFATSQLQSKSVGRSELNRIRTQ